MLDYAIRNCHICDGSGTPCYYGDLGIKDKRIAQMNNLKDEARKTIDIAGLIVSPGFIDMHSHADKDFSLLVHPHSEAKVMQGVTTEVIGNCGMSAYPLGKDQSTKDNSLIFDIPKGIEKNWKDLEDYFNKLLSRGTAVNVVALVGHGTLREAVMGFDNRKPTSHEMERMKQLLREAFQQGAFGLSTGLVYPPGVYADLEEIMELTKIVSEYGGIYASHLRNQNKNLVQCVEEIIEIGQQTKASVQISHLKIMGEKYKTNIGRVLVLMEKAQRNGININADQYPYIAGSSTTTVLLPPWVREGGPTIMLKRLKSDACRIQIKKDLKVEIEGWMSLVEVIGWDNINISSVSSDKNKDLEGHSLLEIAEMRGQSVEDALFDLLIEENGSVRHIAFTTSEEEVKKIMKNPLVMIGSDGIDVENGKPHPRLYGTFPRILGKYVRDEKVIPLEEAVRKMTSLPAKKLGIKDRGLLKEGMMADIVIFDPSRIRDKASFDTPTAFPEGIKYVFINGEPVIENGVITNKLPGMMLDRNDCKK